MLTSMSKKRILFLSHYFYPEGNAPAARVFEMARQWVREGHHVTVLTGFPNVPNGVIYPGYRNAWKQREIIDGIEVIRVWTCIAPNRGTVRRILNYLSYMLTAVLAGFTLKKPDIIIATSPQFFCGLAGLVLKRIKRVPFILEIRDLWPESIAAVGAIRNRLIIGPLEWLEKFMYRSADHIVTVSKAFQAHILAQGGRENAITTITNGVNVQVFQPRGRDVTVRQRHRLNGEFICAYIGTIGLASGLDIVLEAARILKHRRESHIKLMLVGDGAVRESLETQAKKERLDNIIFTGRRDKADIPGYLAAIDACLVHLKKDDLFKLVIPSKMFEAAAMAKPIILGVEGHAAELLKAAGAGCCIEPENAGQLVDTIMHLAQNQARRDSMGAAGRAFVSRYFNRSRLAFDYLELIHKVLESYYGIIPLPASPEKPHLKDTTCEPSGSHTREPVLHEVLQRTPPRTMSGARNYTVFD